MSESRSASNENQKISLPSVSPTCLLIFRSLIQNNCSRGALTLLRHIHYMPQRERSSSQQLYYCLFMPILTSVSWSICLSPTVSNTTFSILPPVNCAPALHSSLTGEPESRPKLIKRVVGFDCLLDLTFTYLFLFMYNLPIPTCTKFFLTCLVELVAYRYFLASRDFFCRPYISALG